MSGTDSAPARRFRVDALNVEVYSTREAMGAAAAAATASWLGGLLAQQRRAAVIFAAAPSQSAMLASLAKISGVAWDRVTGFHMDEYLGLSAEHAASFRRFMHERVERPLRPGCFHFIQGDTDQPLAECERYTRLLQAQPVDLCCLGIGENGHIAFNDPPVADFEDPHLIKLVALDEGCRQQQVAEGHFPSINAVPQYAFTLTVPALCAARRMVCVVPGPRKAEAVRKALTGPVTTHCPASFLRRQAHCTLYLDADSAALLAPAP